MNPEWNSLRKYEGDGTYRTLPELARQLEHERLGGAYRTRQQQFADETPGRETPSPAAREVTVTTPAPLTDSEQLAQLKAEVASLRAEVACLTGFVGDVHKDVGLPIPGVGVTRLGRLYEFPKARATS